MTIQINIPEDVAESLAAQGQDLPRAAIEALALEEYRAGRLSQSQLRRLLGYDTRVEVDRFLKQHGVWLEYTVEDFEREGEISRRVRQQNNHERRAG